MFYAQPLSSGLEDITAILNEKMENYWDAVKNGAKLGSVKMKYLDVLQGINDDLLWSGYESEEDDWTFHLTSYFSKDLLKPWNNC